MREGGDVLLINDELVFFVCVPVRLCVCVCDFAGRGGWYGGDGVVDRNFMPFANKSIR